jgi:hypothetical protein
MKLYDRAIRAYVRRIKNGGGIPMQPSHSASDVTGKLIVLRNRDTELARYTIVRNRLRYIAPKAFKRAS